MKRIGLLTSGGDAPGMNAAIRAVVRTAIYFGMEVYGIERGYAGLIEDKMMPMEMRSVSDIVQRGGTKLRTARCLEMLTKDGQKQAVALADRHRLAAAGKGPFPVGHQEADKRLPAAYAFPLAPDHVGGKGIASRQMPPEVLLAGGGVRRVTSSACAICSCRGLPSAPARP